MYSLTKYWCSLIGSNPFKLDDPRGNFMHEFGTKCLALGRLLMISRVVVSFTH